MAKMVGLYIAEIKYCGSDLGTDHQGNTVACDF
jgi:hypothetical protein